VVSAVDLASLVLGTRYRSLFVFAGVAAAFAVHMVLAVGAGSLLLLLPHRAVEAVRRGLSCSRRSRSRACTEF
jgi:putative Ca2+/H+ antiporter (TMEM165/GDT1 family)